MDSLFASRCPMHPTQTPESKEMQVRRMWVISHQPRPLVRSCSTQTRHQVSSRFSSYMCPFTPLPTLKDDHRSLPANLGGGTEMDTGGDFCSLVHEHAGNLGFATMDSLNLPSSPGKPFKRTRGLARQASFARAKMTPSEKPRNRRRRIKQWSG